MFSRFCKLLGVLITTAGDEVIGGGGLPVFKLMFSLNIDSQATVKNFLSYWTQSGTMHVLCKLQIVQWG